MDSDNQCVPDDSEDTGDSNWWDSVVDILLAPIKAIGSVVEALLQGLNFLVDFVKGLFDWIVDLLKHVFVPSDDFWSDKTGMLQHTLETKFGQEGYKQIFTSLQNVDSADLSNLTFTFMGFTFVAIDLSYVNQNIKLIHMVLYAIFGVLLIRYNLNNFYKAVRGEDLYKGDGEI